MQNAAGTRNTEEGFKVARVVPHHRGDAVTGFQAQFRESGREAARPAIEFAVARANDGLVRLARDDFDARKDLPGPLQDGGQRQGNARRPIAFGGPDNFRLQKGSISATMQLTADVPVSRPRWLGLSRLPVNDCCAFSALRDSKVGSGQKEWAGEEALYRESSVFRDGRAAQRVVLAGWCHTLGRQSNPRPIHGPVTRFCFRRSYER